MKNETEIIDDLISKLISISNISSTSSGYVSIDYRMFCDLISIARSGCSLLNKNHADKFLEQIENNVLRNFSSENETEIKIRAEVPGLDKNDINITLTDGLLTIKGEKKRERKEKEETYYRVERTYGYFNRTIQLPAEVNPDKVNATYKRGILKIKLRKLKENGSKRIRITKG